MSNLQGKLATSPYARPAAKRKSLKPTFVHSPPLPTGPADIFFKSDSGKGGWAFLSNYSPFVKEAALRGCAREHQIQARPGALFTVDNVEYKSVEHFFHSERQPCGQLKLRIRSAEDALSAKKINNASKKTHPSSLTPLEERQLVKAGPMAKFVQNDDLREALLATGARALHEGAGMGAATNRWTLTQDGTKGGDLLGQVLMEVRSELASLFGGAADNKEDAGTRRLVPQLDIDDGQTEM
ncbi:hypothetical protein HKX48_001027 [Thoreauomyces humboldtii]|nr:hypothetical protein HKX48_001027 [Thoreauomyces humboldtii]